MSLKEYSYLGTEMTLDVGVLLKVRFLLSCVMPFSIMTKSCIAT